MSSISTVEQRAIIRQRIAAWRQEQYGHTLDYRVHQTIGSDKATLESIQGAIGKTIQAIDELEKILAELEGGGDVGP